MIRRIILGFALLAPLAAVVLWNTSWIGAIGVVFVSHMLVLYPTLRARSGWLGPVVTSFEPKGNEVWLTIDDGPDAEDTPAILEILRRHQAKATFFVKGTRVRAFPELARRILEEGHSIGNHSDTHPSGTFWCLPPGRIEREIDGCSNAIESATGRRPSWFRAPVGMKNPFVHPRLARRGLKLIAWSARGFDAVLRDPAAIVARMLRDVRPGAIVLAHEGARDSDGRSQAPVVVEGFLAGLDARGFRAVIPDDGALRTE